jgi:hypothetical protein
VAPGAKPPGNQKKLEKVPAAAEVNHEKSTPRFCLRHLVNGFGVSALETSGRAAFAVALEKRAQMTWQEIKQAPKHGLGTEMIPAAQIKASIPTQFSDSERFMVFRYDGKLPMGGVRAGDTFHVLWLEPTFGALYNHG